MTTLTEFHKTYKDTEAMQKPRVILCDWKTQEGVEFSDIQEFDKFVHSNKKEEFYILNQTDTPEITLLEYFRLNKAEPSVIGLRHPLMTNAYWKELPDKIIDIVVSHGIYRYSMVSYGKNLKEYVIEFPSDIDSDVYEYCKGLMPKFFRTKPSQTQTVTLLFSNTNRYNDLDKTNFVTHKLAEIYPDWTPKSINTMNLSRKVWDNIVNIIDSKREE